MTNEKQFLSLLGLAQKAGKLVSGEVAVEKAVKNGCAKILLIAGDSSDGAKKNYLDMAKYYQMPVYIVLSKDQLGMSIGKANRAALAVTDLGFSKAIGKILTT